MDEDDIDKEARRALIELIVLSLILIAFFLVAGVYVLQFGDVLA